MPNTLENIMETEWSDEFIKLQKNRIATAYFRYGSAKENSGLINRLESAARRIQKYKETGNTEWLVDAANNLMFEFMYPQHPKAHFRATNSDESPGLSGVSVGEIKAMSEEMR